MKYIKIILSIVLSMFFCNTFLVCNNYNVYASKSKNIKPKLVIIIDDFGSYDQSGVEEMLSIDAPLTCAVMPEVDNTENNVQQIINSGKEVIVHMPMQANVSLPEFWYGKFYIDNNDTETEVYSKLDRAFKSVENASGFNIHIGSGVCQNSQLMSYIYNYSINNKLPFVDSRTHINTVCEKIALQKNTVYLGRDEFLEPQGNKGYEISKFHLIKSASLAKEKGFAIAIGHVGAHGGNTTAKAIKDSLDEISNMGVEIVPLTTLYQSLKNKKDLK